MYLLSATSAISNVSTASDQFIGLSPDVLLIEEQAILRIISFGLNYLLKWPY